jgi:hypothetical protein
MRGPYQVQRRSKDQSGGSPSRLRRTDEGAAALAPFATGHFGTYRRAEAQRLLDWMGVSR